MTKNLVLKTKNSESIKLLSAFESDVSPNIGFDQMKRVSVSETNVNRKLIYDKKSLGFWSEYFQMFEAKIPNMHEQTKELSIY